MPTRADDVPVDSIAVSGLAETYRAGWRIRRHRHRAHQIVHAASGVMRVEVAGGEWVVPPGRALWVPAGEAHAIRCVAAVAMRTAYLQGRHPAFPQGVRVGSVTPLMREILVRLAEGARPSQVPHLSALLVDEVGGLGEEPLCLPVPRDRRVARLTSALAGDPADATPLTAWARRLGVSERSLIRQIRAETGLTFRELRRQARVLEAVERLAQGQPVTAVALDVGFENPSAFIQAFRAVTGKTPRRYMRGEA